MTPDLPHIFKVKGSKVKPTVWHKGGKHSLNYQYLTSGLSNFAQTYYTLWSRDTRSTTKLQGQWGLFSLGAFVLSQCTRL